MTPEPIERLRTTDGSPPAVPRDVSPALAELTAAAWDAGYLAGSARQIDAAHGLPVADPTAMRNPFRPH